MPTTPHLIPGRQRPPVTPGSREWFDRMVSDSRKHAAICGRCGTSSLAWSAEVHAAELGHPLCSTASVLSAAQIDEARAWLAGIDYYEDRPTVTDLMAAEAVAREYEGGILAFAAATACLNT